MRVIVVGAGEVGYHVAERLAAEHHDVVVVDVSAERLEYVSSHLDVAVLEGSGVSPAVLDQAGLKEARLLIAVTNVDEVNLVCCMSARGTADLVKVARVSNPDFYLEKQHLQPERFGVDVMINPERELAVETIRLLQSTAATDIAVFADGAVQFIGLMVTEDAPIANRRLMDIGAEEEHQSMLTVAIERDGKTIVPTGTTEVLPGDHLYVAAAARDIPRALKLCGHQPSALKRVMITGGSDEAFYLARLLQHHGVQTTMLVRDRVRAQQLAEKLHKALILQGSPTDVELMELEGVGGMDAFVALSEADETNILSALVARHAGAKQVITLVNQVQYFPVARRVGIDAAVSPRLSAANAILRYVRRGSVTRVATFKDSSAEAISFQVSASCPLEGKSLADAKIPPGAILAAIVRGPQVIVPRGRDVLQVGDTAIVFALPEAVKAVTKLFPS